MNTVTHALTMNGRINTELRDPLDPPEVTIRKRLSLLDGERRFSLGLWALPNGVDLDQIDRRTWPQEYIQAAGSQERMTVEIRRIEAGKPKQYVIGHDGPNADDDRADEVIKWNGVETRVHRTEVFERDEVADLFISYRATGLVPETYALRPLEL